MECGHTRTLYNQTLFNFPIVRDLQYLTLKAQLIICILQERKKKKQHRKKSADPYMNIYIIVIKKKKWSIKV